MRVHYMRPQHAGLCVREEHFRQTNIRPTRLFIGHPPTPIYHLFSRTWSPIGWSVVSLQSACFKEYIPLWFIYSLMYAVAPGAFSYETTRYLKRTDPACHNPLSTYTLFFHTKYCDVSARIRSWISYWCQTVLSYQPSFMRFPSIQVQIGA